MNHSVQWSVVMILNVAHLCFGITNVAIAGCSMDHEMKRFLAV